MSAHDVPTIELDTSDIDKLEGLAQTMQLPLFEGFRLATATVNLTGAVALVLASEKHRALYEALRLGAEVEVTVSVTDDHGEVHETEPLAATVTRRGAKRKKGKNSVGQVVVVLDQPEAD